MLSFEVIKTTKMKEELTILGFEVFRIERMYIKTNGGKIFMPLVLVQIQESNRIEDISDISNIRMMIIQIEPQRIIANVLQSNRC